MEAYSQRLRQLEAFIHAHGLAIPSMDPDNEAILTQLLSLYAPDASPRPSHAQTNSPETAINKRPRLLPDLAPITSTAADPTDGPQLLSFDPLDVSSPNMQAMLQASEDVVDISGVPLPFNSCLDVDWVWDHSMMAHADSNIDMEDVGLWMQNPLPGTSSNLSPSRSADDDDSTDDEDHSAVTNQLSARLGSLLTTGNGERHFYGATSNLNFAQGGIVSALHAKPSRKGAQASSRLEAAGLDHFIGRDVEDHLLQLYFTWHNPSLYTVDQTLFSKAHKKYEEGDVETPFFSPFLLNAM